ncbi:MAG: sigma-70 family RNA polymerase sigma factor [Sulfuricella sp.]|nr:sigma-70 family RNA polymerase sigma factor [Sulfuricella sp.]
MPQKKNNNKNNLHVLFENHAHELGVFAQRRVDSEAAADIVQDTYLRVLQYADQGALENPRAYLYRVAANVAADRGAALKAYNDRLELDVDLDSLGSTAPGPEAVVDARKQLQRCLAALDELPAAYRHVFLLHRIDGLSHGEIAGALDIPKRTVERYVAKALEHCLKSLDR